MRDLKNNLTSSKSSRNIQSKKTKGFGYQILGFGSGGGAKEYTVNFLVIAGGGAGGGGAGGSGGEELVANSVSMLLCVFR